MHKTLLSLALAFATPLLVQAQSTPEAPAAATLAAPDPDAPDTGQDLTVGFKVIGGVGLITGNDADVLSRSIGNGIRPISTVGTEQRPLATGGAGLTANLKLGKMGWGVQAELLYMLKGGQLLADNYRTNLYLHYASLPLLARYQQGGFYAEAGPQISYLIDAQIEQANQETTPILTGSEITNRSAYNEVEWGYAVGVGYNFRSNVVLGLRYNAAVRPLLTKVPNTTEIKAYNTGVEVHLGLLFGKKRPMAAVVAPTGGM